MSKNLQFSNLTAILIASLVAISLILAISLQNKLDSARPSILALQSKYDGQNDRIVQTQNDPSDIKTIFSAPDIITFESTKDQVLVATGTPNSPSNLTLLDLKTNKTQNIQFKNKIVNKILSGGSTFALLSDTFQNDKQSYLFTIDILKKDQPQPEPVNPQFLATSVNDIYLNPGGNLLVFDSFDSNQYIVDLQNPDRDKIAKFQTLSKFSLGFINDFQFAYQKSETLGNYFVEVLDLRNNEIQKIDSKVEFFIQFLASQDLKYRYILTPQPNDSSSYGIRKIGDKIGYSNDNFRIERIDIHPQNQFLLASMRPKSEQVAKDMGIQFADYKFTFFSTAKNTFDKVSVTGKKAVFIK
jgi:hypothetical protein